MEASENGIFYCIIGFMCAEFLWELYLSIRQHRVYEKNIPVPDELIGIISKDKFEKARLYGLDKSLYGMIKDSYSLVLLLVLLLLDMLPTFWDIGGKMIQYLGYNPEDTDNTTEILQSSCFLLVFNTVTTVTSLPFSIYYTFVLEEKHGFNKQTASFFIKDKIKAFILNQVILIPVMCGITYIVKIGGDYFFIYLWLFTMAVTLFLMSIYPDYIAPWFDKYTPLPEGGLKDEIEKLAASVDFPLYKIYVVEGSKRSYHSNAYFYGFFKNKRIVLYDTLLKDKTPSNASEEGSITEEKSNSEGDGVVDKEKESKGCDTNEILAVLGHELGHWKLNHLIKNLVIMQINLLLIFVVFGSLYQYQPVYKAFGFYNCQPVLIGLLIVLQFIFSPYHALVSFFLAILSRQFEFDADRFAKSLGRSNYLRLALIKLNSDNLGYPIYDPWYSMWHHSHPPLLERLRALEKDD